MIEEAAGTRMYETKKQASIKTIEKKQLKVDEITKCINEEITPTLESLRSERQDYHAWQANSAEFEKMERFCIAFEFKAAEVKVHSSEQDRANLENEHQSLLAMQTEKHQQAEICANQIAEIVKRRDEEMGGEMAELKKTEADLSKEVVKVNTLYTNQQENITSEQETIKQVTNSITSADRSLQGKQIELQECNELIVAKEDEYATAEKNYVTMRDKYQNACAGVTDESTAELLAVPEQIIAWEKCERETTSKVQQCQQRIQHFTSVASEMKKSNKTETQSHSALLRQVEEGREEVAGLQRQMTRFVHSEAEERQIKANLQKISNEIEEVTGRANAASANVEARLQFEYRDPEPRFDRTRVKGMVAKLFTMIDAHTATALEVVAGGKLTQIVVDNEQTGKALLQNGQLRKRVTILPLSKLSSRVISEDKVNRAKQLARSMRGEANLALDLIRFDESVRRAMEFTFGGAIVCSTSDIAKAIAFDKNLRLKTVTLEGDSFDPSGTLTGGSNNNLGTLLAKIESLRQLQSSLAEKKEDAARLQRDLTRVTKAMEEVAAARSQVELKAHALKILEEKLGDSDFSQATQRQREAEQELAVAEQEMGQLQELLAKSKAELKKLSSSEKSKAKQRDQKLKEFEAEVKQVQKVANALKNELLSLRARRDAVDAERQGLMKEQLVLSEQKQMSENSLKRLKSEAKGLDEKVNIIVSFFISHVLIVCLLLY